MRRALICSISGQDGAYLARFLLEKGYEVWGTSRDAQASTFGNLLRLGILDRVKTVSMAANDFRSVVQSISHSEPDEIYNLAGQSSVGLSFEQPAETLESIATGTLNLLEVIRFLGLPLRFYNAGSSECFGDVRVLRRMKALFFNHVVPMLWPKARHTGWLPTIDLRMGSLLVMAFYLIMNPHCVHHASSLE